MVEPTESVVPKVTPTTPTEPVASPVVRQPVPTVPDTTALESKIKELEERDKRHKEQLKGKDKLIGELQIKKIVASMEPDDSEPLDVDTPEPVVPAKRSRDSLLARETIENSIFINRIKMTKEFGNDTLLPFTDDIALEVEKKLEELDPSCKAKMNKNAWEAAYKMVKADKAPSIVEASVNKVRKEIEEQQAKEAASFVEPAATVVADPTPSVTIEDVLSGKVKMSTKEMLERFPEIRSQYSDRILKMGGLI
jgi:hypothetical protein